MNKRPSLQELRKAAVRELGLAERFSRDFTATSVIRKRQAEPTHKRGTIKK